MRCALLVVLAVVAGGCDDDDDAFGSLPPECTLGSCTASGRGCVRTPDGPVSAPCPNGCARGECLPAVDPMCPTDVIAAAGIQGGYCEGMTLQSCIGTQQTTTTTCTAACFASSTGQAACVSATDDPLCDDTGTLAYRRCDGTVLIVCLGHRRTTTAVDCAATGETCSATNLRCQ